MMMVDLNDEAVYRGLRFGLNENEFALLVVGGWGWSGRVMTKTKQRRVGGCSV
jgi:hypothetical protein